MGIFWFGLPFVPFGFLPKTETATGFSLHRRVLRSAGCTCLLAAVHSWCEEAQIGNSR